MRQSAFVHDIRHNINLLPFSNDIRKRTAGLLRSPLTVEVARRTVDTELITQREHLVEQARKRCGI